MSIIQDKVTRAQWEAIPVYDGGEPMGEVHRLEQVADYVRRTRAYHKALPTHDPLILEYRIDLTGRESVGVVYLPYGKDPTYRLSLDADYISLRFKEIIDFWGEE